MTPVFKKGDPILTINYHPISVLSVFSKIFEKCMYSRVYWFLSKYNVFCKRQFGFRSDHSTNDALISLIELLKRNLDNGLCGCGIFIDLRKAFDTVDHSILLSKLNYYGVCGVANEWFKSYLSDRRQFVSIAGFRSDSKSVCCGVLQGSTLGSVLFLIYINDLHQVFDKAIVHHFENDTVYFSQKLTTIETVLNYELKFLNWNG